MPAWKIGIWCCWMAVFCWCGQMGAGYGEPTIFRQMVHDFGVVPRGTLLLHRFVCTNTTTERLELHNLPPTCACVRVQTQPELLEPGETGHVEVEVDTRTFAGNRTVGVPLQLTPGRRTVWLQVRAHSHPDIRVHPGLVRFAGLEAGQTAEQSLGLEYQGPLDWQIVAIYNPYPFLSAWAKPLCRRPGTVEYQVTVRLGEHAPLGNWCAALSLRTNDPHCPNLPIFVEGQIRPVITASPPRLQFQARANAMCQERVSLRGQQPFRILAVQETPPGFTVELTSDRLQTMHVVSVCYQAPSLSLTDGANALAQNRPSQTVSHALPSTKHVWGVIRLATDCPRQPSLEIPVHATLLP